MKSFLLHVSKCLKGIPLSQLMHLSGQKIICPFYHAVENKEEVHLKYAYPVKSLNAFEKDLDQMLKHYEPVDYSFIQGLVAGTISVSRPVFMLTFDDGLSSLYHVVAPLLKHKGIPATIFINNNFIDNKDLFYRYKASLLCAKLDIDPIDQNQGIALGRLFNVQATIPYLKKIILSVSYAQRNILDDAALIMGINFGSFLKDKQPYLSSDQIKSLIKDGFTIGGHSMDHPLYNALTEEEQLQQTLKSVLGLRSQFGQEDLLFSFPFTDEGISAQFFDRLTKKLGESVLSFGTAGMKHETIHTHIQRIPMEYAHTSALDIIRMEYLYYLLKMPLGKNTIQRY